MNRFWKAVLTATMVAGTMDIIAAHIDQAIRTGQFPSRIFYAIAAGMIGLKNAFGLGPGVIMLGVLIHYLISFLFTLFYFVAYPLFRSLSPNKYLNGFVYALFVWATMTFIVLPLTALPHKPFVLNMNAMIAPAILVIAFGLPVSLMADRYYSKRNEWLQHS